MQNKDLGQPSTKLGFLTPVKRKGVGVNYLRNEKHIKKIYKIPLLQEGAKKFINDKRTFFELKKKNLTGIKLEGEG